MAKQPRPIPEQPIASTLIKSREEVKGLLEAQITAAGPILEMRVDKVPGGYSYDMFGTARSHVEKYDKSQQDEFFRQYEIWNNRNKEIFKRSFEHPYNTDYDGYTHSGVSYFVSDIVEEQKSTIRDKIAFIQGFIQRLDLIPCSVEAMSVAVIKSKIDREKVFIVHGHNDLLKIDVARTVEKMGLKAIILHEQEDYGKTIIEKFETNAEDIGFAIILLTGDDLGVSKKDLSREKIEKGFNAEYRPRSRQNVIFEMGYFIGKLGRSNVFELLENGVEKPGDLDGVIYTPVDSEGVWKFKLAKRLDAVGYSIDTKAIL